MLDANHVRDMDNSGRGPLRVPGFGEIPVDCQLPVDARFAHGIREWRQSPMVTAQELAMVAVMDRLTDKPAWFVDVFDDGITAQWRAELDRDHFIANPRLMQDRTWAWCVQELRDKAVYYKEHQYIRVLDTGSCVCKADSAELQSLGAVFRQAVVPLVYQYRANQERQKRQERRRQPEDGRTNQFEQDADAGENDARSDTRRQAQDADHEPIGDGHAMDDDALTTEENEEFEEADHMTPGASDNHQEFEENENQAEDHNEIWHPNIVEDGSEGSLSESVLMFDDDLMDLVDMEDDDGDNGEDENAIDPSWGWNSQARLTHEGKVLNIAGSSHMISALVDPLLFPLVYGRTLVLQHGGTVALDNVLASYGAAQAAPRHSAKQSEPPELLTLMGDDLVLLSPWSRRYQSLPCEVAFVNDGSDGHHINDVKITSYINGLHPIHAEMYRAIEQVLSHAIQPWNDCLVRGHRGLHDPSNLGQLGPVPARIITYGVEWENELPDWATAFRVPTEIRKQAYHERQKQVQLLPEGSRKRKREEGYLQSMFADVIGREDWTLPPRDSELWQRAKEYFARPERQPDLDGNAASAEPVAVPGDDDWDIGDGRTWDLLCEKARRLLCHKHPEPGTAFAYEEWRLGLHESRPVVDKAAQEPKQKADRRAPPITPPHIRYTVALQDRFRDQGLQVLVEISSIELTPETPAYAPDAAAWTAAYAARTAKEFAKAVSSNTFVNLDGQPLDVDGWRLAGQLNEHIVGVAWFAFDVDNVTEPRLAFRQRTSLDFRLHRFNECFKLPENAPEEYDFYFLTDGPAHLVGKERDAGALAEILGVPESQLEHDGTGTRGYQHIGSVAAPRGRLVAFPNVLEHRLDPFRLVDGTKPGRYRWLTLYLVDPHYRVCSTRNVPPQQHDWWADAVGRELAVSAGLSQEIIDQIMRGTDNWPMGVDEAQWHRAQLIEEHRRGERYRLKNVRW